MKLLVAELAIKDALIDKAAAISASFSAIDNKLHILILATRLYIADLYDQVLVSYYILFRWPFFFVSILTRTACTCTRANYECYKLV